MRVLITGGGGNLGRVLAPTLEEVGHEPILMDNRDLETSHKAVRGDVRDRDSVLEVFRETDVVVHAAALHGNRRGSENDDELSFLADLKKRAGKGGGDASPGPSLPLYRLIC